MKKLHGIEQIWQVRHFHKGKVIWEMEKKNIIVDEGEKAFVDSFYRDNSSLYFSTAKFWVGLYQGNINETTILTTIPNEPDGSAGYSRQSIPRTTLGWPTIEQNDGDWRVVSQTVTFQAFGGNIGPISGSFLCTSDDNSGVLIGALSFSFERTIPAGDIIELEIRAKHK